MGTVVQAKISQTHYVTVRRDELQQLKDERAQLQSKVASLTSILEQARLALS